jgi:transposase
MVIKLQKWHARNGCHSRKWKCPFIILPRTYGSALYGVATSFRKALVISVDETRRWSWPPVTWKPTTARLCGGRKSTYKRPGTLNLFAALQVATGLIQTATTTRKRREEFLEFIDQIVAETPAERQLHVILDNYCTHKKCDAWLALPSKVRFHSTATSASWINQVEIWFGILSRKALRGASFKNVTELRQAIEAFIAAYKRKAKPFKWRKREVKGSQLRNTIVNLCN